MRDCHRNKRTLYYAKKVAENPIIDEWGNDTLESENVYSVPKKREMNVSSATGKEVVAVFGNMTEYSRAISTTDVAWDIEVGDVVWFNHPTEEPFNYVVVQIADSKNSLLVALKEVNVSHEDNHRSI